MNILNYRVLLMVLAFAFMGCAVQAQTAIKTADYTVKEGLDMAGARLLSFNENHNLNRMANLQWSGMVEDSLFFFLWPWPPQKTPFMRST